MEGGVTILPFGMGCHHTVTATIGEHRLCVNDGDGPLGVCVEVIGGEAHVTVWSHGRRTLYVVKPAEHLEHLAHTAP